MTTPASPLRSLGRLLVFSPLAMTFVDDFTGLAPVGSIVPTLLIESPPGSGKFVATGVRGLFTRAGILAYPNLGRRGKLPDPPETPRNYRVSIQSHESAPLYPDGLSAPGFGFSVTPYDGGGDFSILNPTAATVKPTYVSIPMIPRPNYPFGGIGAIVKGKVIAASGGPVVALMTAVEPFDDTPNSKQTRVVTDAAGVFQIPLRWGNEKSSSNPPQPTPTKITALDPISGKFATISLPFPYDLKNPQTITIPNL